MNNVTVAEVGNFPHGRVDVTHDTEATLNRPIRISIKDDAGTAWLTPEQVRELRKVLKPFASPKAVK